jgi:hypothetical protein
VGQDEVGLVLDEVGEGAVALEEAGGGGHAGHQHVLGIVAGPGEGAVDRRSEALDLAVQDGPQQLLLAALEGAVDGGPAAARFPGHVLQGGLRDAPAGDAPEGGLANGVGDVPHRLRR